MSGSRLRKCLPGAEPMASATTTHRMTTMTTNNIVGALASVTGAPVSQFSIPSVTCISSVTLLTYTTLPTVNLPPSSISSSDLSAGSIAGIVIGSVVRAASIVGAGAYWYLRHKNSGSRKYQDSDGHEMVVAA